VQISARADYALRALCVLATAAPDTAVKAAVIAEAQAIPRTFLDQILTDLRRSGIVDSRRGPDGGHKLARPSYAITVADVVRAVDGPLALVRGELPESLLYAGPAEHLREVWIAVRAGVEK
jgi:Rrf2 family protein